METHRLLREMFQKLSCSFDPLQVADQRARWASGSMASNTLSAARCPGFCCWWCPNAPWDLVGGWIFTYYYHIYIYIIKLNLAGDDPHGLVFFADRNHQPVMVAAVRGRWSHDHWRYPNPPDQKIPPQRSARGLSHRLISILPWMILDDEYVDGRSSR